MVLTVDEVRRILAKIPDGPVQVMAGLMYGAGLRIMEACRLRVKDIDFVRKQIVVREGKGDKDRVVPLPDRLVENVKPSFCGPSALSSVLPMTWPGLTEPPAIRAHPVIAAGILVVCALRIHDCHARPGRAIVVE